MQQLLRVARLPRVLTHRRETTSSLRTSDHVSTTAAAFGTARQRVINGYLASIGGVALVTVVIGWILARVHIENISLLYLLVILWLAARYGRGPAVLASFLAFLTFDFFFIPPVHLFTVDDPTEWLSLFALLATSLVLGQLTAAVQARARDAIASQQDALASRQLAIGSERRTAQLYALAQFIASTRELPELLEGLAQHVVDVFAPAGVQACSLILPDADGQLISRVAEPSTHQAHEALTLNSPERAAQASYVFSRGTAVGSIVRQARTRASLDETLVYFLPLLSSQKTVGVLGIAGTAQMRAVVADISFTARHDSAWIEESTATITTRLEESGLLAAYCDQIALALDRYTLLQHAIHAEALQESDQLKNALLGSVTHDLRTPLAAIQAAAESLLASEVSWSEADRQEFLRTIITSVGRLNRLVSNLLDLSRLESGTAQPEMQWHDIEDVLATVLDRLDLAGRLRDRTIEIETIAELPLVPLDHGQIEQVLTNLIENALKYSPVESPIVVHARFDEAASALQVSVSDAGIGIPAGELRAIFDKFYRVQHVELPWATSRPPTGTGLGLAICQGILAAHGGSIWVESEVGKGSTFTFTLPVPQDSEHGQHEHGGLPEILPEEVQES